LRKTRLVNVFDVLLAEVGVSQRQSLTDISVSRAGNRDPSGLSKTLQAGGDIHTVPQQVPSPDHHVADVHADPELKPPILGLPRARLCQLLLHRNGTLNGIDRARELSQDAIASRICDPAPVVPNQPIHDLASGSQGAECPSFVLADQARVPGHIRSEDRCQPSLDPLFLFGRHRSPLSGAVASVACHSPSPALRSPSR
jgi:hypothetical protein